MSSRRRLALAAALALALGGTATRAAPGPAFLALAPASGPGAFVVDDYLRDPGGWAAQAATHDRGWSVAWRGDALTIVRRGGGSALIDGAFNPRYAAAIDEMLPARRAAILALLDPPDPVASSPGKPNPQPFERDGWLFLHDGSIGVEAITMQDWRAPWGDAWDAFKLAHPRDYDGNGDSTRGEASEIYGLLFLYELQCGPGDASDALERVIWHLAALEGSAGFQFNALALSAGGLWAVRYAPGDAEGYPVYYGLTSDGEHCVTDALPPSGQWRSLPNFTIARFPPDGPVELRPLASGAIDDAPAPAPFAIALRALRSPAIPPLRLECALPPGAGARLELWSVDGRRVATLPVAAGSRDVRWELPGTIASGVYLARLRSGSQSAGARLAILR
jgi:hypothetical protein